MQPVRTFRQIRRPDDDAISGVALAITGVALAITGVAVAITSVALAITSVAVAITDLPLRDDPATRDDLPVQRQGSRPVELGPRRLTGANHHRLAQKPVRRPHRQRIEDNLQCHGVRHMAVTLAVHKFGLDTQLFGSGKKVHSARHLHTTVGDRRKIL